MESYPKYRYPEPVKIENRQWPDRLITKAPVWASVDLRDGNQALPEPMTPERKLEYFNMLVEDRFQGDRSGISLRFRGRLHFVRMLIEENLIPDDVTISVLTQARKHLIDKTAESLRGVKRAIIHCYVRRAICTAGSFSTIRANRFSRWRSPGRASFARRSPARG